MDEKTCKRCGETRPADQFVFNRSAANGGNICKPCRRKRDAETREANREKIRISHREWRRANPERVREHARARAARLRQAILDAYGRECECCGEQEESFLTLDHIGGGGAEHRRESGSHVYADLQRKGFPPGHRILCFNCNWAYWISEHCPHQKAK